MILALDLGTRRVGVAKSDESDFLASAFTMIPIQSFEDLIGPLGKILTEVKPSRVIVGYPVTMSGTMGIAAQDTEKKVGILREKFPEIPFELSDERLTTKAAEVYLRQIDRSRKKRKAKIDSLAAEILLQNYLDLKSRR